MPKFEKMDEFNLKVTQEVSRMVNIPKLIIAKKQLEEQVAGIQEQLKAITEAIEEAKKLGLDVSGKVKPTPKPTKGKKTS